jgi:5-methylcytosine-specific restriction endonuclease McrA
MNKIRTSYRCKIYLKLIATDRTFKTVNHDGDTIWAGRCFHCNSKLSLNLEGKPISAITLEHIRPRSQGGVHEVNTAAICYARCNHQKGYRIDHLGVDHPLVHSLQANWQDKGRQRWREPEA